MMSKSKLSKNIVILSIVSFLNDVSSEMVYPIVPIFLSSFLGVPTNIIGLIEGLADATSKILMAVSGYISDKLHKRKLFVEVGYGFAAVSHLILALSSSWPLVLFSRVINRSGKGLRTAARDAIITESTDKENRGFSFGFHRTMDGLGGVIGPLLGVLLLGVFAQNYKAVFFLAFIPAMIGALTIFFLVTDKKRASGDDLTMRFDWSKTSSSFRIFLLISFIFAIGNSSDAFLILRSQNLGVSVSLTIFAYVVFNLVSSLFSLPAGILADKFGSKKVIFLGFLIFSLVYGYFGWTSSAWTVWLLFPLYGVYMAMTEGVSKAYISKLVPHEILASTFGIYQTAMGFATLIASTIAGALWSSYGPRVPFYYGSIMALVASLLFLFLSKRIKVLPRKI